MAKKDFSTAQPGFTLLELVISIAIIAVMTALLGYYWSFSTEKAKITEIEKTVRTLKDSIDTKTLDDYVAVKSTSNYILGRRVYELVDTDQHKKTNHFIKNPLHDVSIIFACDAPETDCDDFKLDNAKFQGALIVYAIGKQTAILTKQPTKAPLKSLQMVYREIFCEKQYQAAVLTPKLDQWSLIVTPNRPIIASFR